MGRSKITVIAMIGIAIYTIIFLGSLRDGHSWGDDFAQYIRHAQNILTGSGYSQTDYIDYRGAERLGPRSLPPVTPVILAPIYAAFGLNLNAMKAGLFLFFSGALVVLFFYFRRLENPPTAWVLTAVVALNPYVWEHKDEIGSELPFIFFLYSTLLLCLVRDQVSLQRGRFLAGCLAGLTAYLAYATRSIGGAVVAGILVHDLLHRRRLLVDTAPIVAIFALGYVTQTHLMNVQPDYFDYAPRLHLHGPEWILNNVIRYVESLRGFLPGLDGIPKMAAIFLLLLLSGFFAQLVRNIDRESIGTPRRLLSSVVSAIRLQEVFIAGYLLAFFLLPFHPHTRYLFPVFPLLVFYAAAGLIAVCRLVGGSWRRWGKMAAGVIALYYVGFYAVVMVYGKPIVHGPHVPESIEMFKFVRTELPEDAVVIFKKPRAAALFGERASAIWPRPSGKRSAKLAWDAFAKIGATHLIIAKKGSGLSQPYYLSYHLLPPVNYLTPVFNNDHFTIYRIERYPEHDGPD